MGACLVTRMCFLGCAEAHILQKSLGYEKMVMVGDGATDLEARQIGGADIFIGYLSSIPAPPPPPLHFRSFKHVLIQTALHHSSIYASLRNAMLL